MKLTEIGNVLEERNKQMKLQLKGLETNTTLNKHHRRCSSFNVPVSLYSTGSHIHYIRFHFDNESPSATSTGRSQNLPSFRNNENLLRSSYNRKSYQKSMRIPAFPKCPFGAHRSLNNSSLIFTEVPINEINEDQNEENIKLIKSVNGRNTKRRNTDRENSMIPFRHRRRINSLRPHKSEGSDLNLSINEYFLGNI